jgi:hypothetical protein
MNQVTASASIKPQTYFRLGERTTRLGASPQTASATTNLGCSSFEGCNASILAVLSELNAGNMINMKNDLRRCDVSAVDYWYCRAVSVQGLVGRASALTSFGWRGCERGWPWGKGGGLFMDGRWKGLIGLVGLVGLGCLGCLGCLECLEAFPTPSSAVTGNETWGSLAGPHGPFVHLQGCSRCRAWPRVISCHGCTPALGPPARPCAGSCGSTAWTGWMGCILP